MTSGPHQWRRASAVSPVTPRGSHELIESSNCVWTFLNRYLAYERLMFVGCRYARGNLRLGHAASDELKDAARKWIDKLLVKNGSYPPDSYPNPGELPTYIPLSPFHRALNITANVPMLPLQLLRITTRNSKPVPSARNSTRRPSRILQSPNMT